MITPGRVIFLGIFHKGGVNRGVDNISRIGHRFSLLSTKHSTACDGNAMDTGSRLPVAWTIAAWPPAIDHKIPNASCALQPGPAPSARPAPVCRWQRWHQDDREPCR